MGIQGLGFDLKKLKPSMNLQNLFYMALAGALGTLFRFLLAEGTYFFLGRSLPFGTFIVNVLGCFIFGFVGWFFAEYIAANESLRLVIFVGFLGAFTTFSSLIYESDALIQGGYFFAGLGNVLLSSLAGFLALRLGIMTATLLQN